MITLSERCKEVRGATYQVAFSIGRLLNETPPPKNILQEVAYDACLTEMTNAHMRMGCYAMEKNNATGFSYDR